MGFRAVQIANLSQPTRRKFARALHLLGKGSQSAWLSVQVRRVIREAAIQFGEGFEQTHLTEEEQFVCEVIADGAAEIGEIARESMIHEQRVRAILKRLLEYGWIEERRKGGKTDAARGATIKLYFPKRPISAAIDGSSK
jgi:DNA-binding MarR family transcriptional regulator